ncbi:hypothetical protein Lfu02_51840 [Longispora fulva]|uniref:Uncharacterized protein n=1 Tax=Longispora fulva TaxID=619741 RepID=A0A8J7KTN1_9ACTN|nr:hypothetical protein [Longispora fulva]MBG6140922.1 hypothetical protein [Longispora fulva]GIG60812.1 hypothetical protein Lfu02_51840 [Longispora fulva]
MADSELSREEYLAEARERRDVQAEIWLDEHAKWLVYLCVECRKPWPCEWVTTAERFLGQAPRRSADSAGEAPTRNI